MVITVGEILVGLGLIFGVLTGIAAFLGRLMNVNYLRLEPSAPTPVCATWLVLAWRIAGWYGFDRYLLPRLGTPGAPVAVVKNQDTAGALAGPGRRGLIALAPRTV